MDKWLTIHPNVKAAIAVAVLACLASANNALTGAETWTMAGIQSGAAVIVATAAYVRGWVGDDPTPPVLHISALDPSALFDAIREGDKPSEPAPKVGTSDTTVPFAGSVTPRGMGD